MNKKVLRKILFAVFAVALCAAAYFAADIPFFQFDDYEYQDKGAALFSTQWLSAMLPFGIILLVSAVCIALDVLLRKLLYKKENVVWVNISFLRKKLTELGAHAKIKAVRGVGYSLENTL